MRPHATRSQDHRLPPEILNPRTATGIRALHAGMRVMTSPPAAGIRALGSGLSAVVGPLARPVAGLLGLDLSRVRVAAEDVELPSYPVPVQVGAVAG
jgi:hypothetical protein